MLRIALLGRLEVTADEAPVEVAGARARDLVTVLALQAGRPLPADSLIARCWGDSPAADPRASLHAAIRRLRKQLGAHNVTTGGHGYGLAVEPDAVDATLFGRLLGRPGAVPRDDLERALRLWREVPFAPDACPWLREVERPRLTELYLRAVERRADLDLADGSASLLERVVLELRELAGQHPLRESLWSRVLSAMARSGRRAEALQLHAEVRERIAEELGVDPGPELLRTFELLLRDAPHDTGEPIDTDSGDTGSSTVVRGPDRPPAAAHGVAASLPVPRQLPPSVPSFHGRTELIFRLDEILAGRRDDDPTTVVVLSGPPGVGKTSLAVYWGQRHAATFTNGQLFCPLSGFGPHEPLAPGAAAASVLGALGLPAESVPHDLAGRSALLRSSLAGRPTLMVLDDARDAEQVRPLLPASGAVVLVTSRARLRGLISRDGAHSLDVAVLPTHEATAFLAGRIEADAPSRERLARHCGGLPLALAVAAEQAVGRPGDGLADMLDELDSAPDRLDVLRGDEPATDVRSVLDWSYRALDPDTAGFFRLLGTSLVGDYAVAGAAALTGCTLQDARASLRRLTDLHLVTQTDTDRFRQHDLVREFAKQTAERDDGPDEVGRARTRELDWCIHTVHNARSWFAPAVGTLDAPGPPDPQLPALRFGDTDTARQWYVREAPGLCRTVMAAARIGHDLQAARLGTLLWNHLATRGLPAEAIVLLRTVRDCARRARQPLLAALAVNQLGTAYGMDGQLDRCRDLLLAARQEFVRLGSERGKVVVDINLGTLHSRLGDHDKAVRYSERALAVARRLGHDSSIGTALNNLADAQRRRGDLPAALKHGQEGLDLVEQQSNPYLMAFLLDTVGQIMLAGGDAIRAAELFARAADHDLVQQRPKAAAEHLVRLGDALVLQGRVADALDAWRRALDRVESMPAVPHTFDAAAIRQRIECGSQPAPDRCGGAAQPKKTSASA